MKKNKAFMVVAIWKKTESQGKLRIEAFTSVKGFLDYYPGRSYNTVMNYISRDQKPFEDEELTLYRVEMRKRKATTARARKSPATKKTPKKMKPKKR
jgi:hypothetical protein